MEYVPQGFELDDDDEESTPKSEDEVLQNDLAEVDEDTDSDETLEADETMKWDEEEEGNLEEQEYDEHTSPPDEVPEQETK